MMRDTRTPSGPKLLPYTMGLAFTADLWLWGCLALYVPSFFGILSWLQYIFCVIGYVLVCLSLGFALVELAKLRESEGLSYVGVSLVFLIPAGGLFITVQYQLITDLLGTIAKVFVVLLVALGGALLFHGLAYFFWKPPRIATEAPTSPAHPSEADIGQASRQKTNLEIIANIIIALLSLAAAIFTFVERILP